MIRFRRSRIKLKILLAEMTRQPREVVLRHKFNLCAADWADNLESAHTLIADRAVQKMPLSAGDRILELGCGDGWASCMMARAAGESARVVGLDISDAMIRHARAKSASIVNVEFVCARAERIPYGNASFTKVLSIEAFYYFEDQEGVLRELLRVTSPGGQLLLAFCLFKDYPEGLSFADEVSVPVQIRSASEYVEMLRRAGWSDVHNEEFVIQDEPGRRKPRDHARTLFISARKAECAARTSWQNLAAS